MECIESFNFQTGRRVGRRYVVVERLGAGWEGEVYRLVEETTGIDRVAKFYFPHRNKSGRAAQRYAIRLHRLRDCPIVIQYIYHDWCHFHKARIEYVVSDYVEGELLSRILSRQPGKRFHTFEALHVLLALARGIEQVHARGEYHGDIHTDNILVRRRGLSFEMKILDFYDLGRSNKEKRFEDVLDMIHVFYEILGGRRHYARQPAIVHDVCKGLKRTLIRRLFHNAGDLKRYLEKYGWDG
ncbi:MAG: serine/threonine protein kinase [bacterium]|nr:MAG: serine/threonine protein kinase [bacterium]